MTLSLSPEIWIRSSYPLPQARLRLFCLPYAGGDASLFHAWPQLLPPDLQECIEICPIHLPGRAHRIREPLFTSIAELVDVLVPSDLRHSPLYPFLDKPFAFFGASLGGIISFEIARALDTRHQVSASAFCVAACRAPHLPGPYGIEGSDQVADADLIEQIRALGGTPEHLLSDERHLRLILPKVRADSLMAATYAYEPGIGLDCPITVCGAQDDGLVSLADLAAWQAHTPRSFRLYTFPGTHFFIRDAIPQTRVRFLDCFTRSLRDVLMSEYATDPGALLGTGL